MQFLASVLDDSPNSATPEEVAAIHGNNDRLQADGHGPFLEPKEFIGGFWIVEARDLDAALKLAAEGSKHCNRKVEVRRFL